MKNALLLVASIFAVAACAPTTNSQNEIQTSADQAGIIGGDKVSASSNIGRSTVGIYESKIGYICTGTLIAKNLVLTAAHCVDPKAKNLEIYFTPEIKGAKPEQRRTVNTAIVHDKYKTDVAAKESNDIAILRFDGEAPAGYEVAPMLFDQGYLYNNRNTIVAGYGLNFATIIKKGAGVLRTTRLPIDDVNYSATEVLLGQSVRKGICSGDSGGPAYLEINGQLYVWGVASRGDSIPIFFVPKCMLFSVFSRVDAYQTWIQDTMRSLQ